MSMNYEDYNNNQLKNRKEQFFRRLGYYCLGPMRMGQQVFYQIANDKAKVILYIDGQKEQLWSRRRIEEALFQTRMLFERGSEHFPNWPEGLVLTDVSVLGLFFAEDSHEAAEFVKELPMVWMIDTKTYRLCLYEAQIGDYYGLRKPLEQFLLEEPQNKVEEQRQNRKNLMRSVCNVNSVLVVLTIGVYVILSLFGDMNSGEYLLEKGAIYVPYILEEGQWYRLFTAMFLHFGIEHLLNNMVTLSCMGKYLLDYVGTVRYLVVYIVSGLFASIVSVMNLYLTDDYAVSAGASGAIFGVMGALVSQVIINRKKKSLLSVRGMVIMAGLSIYFGFTTAGVDNAAHVGGFLMGLLLGAICSIPSPKKTKKVS